MTIRGRIRRHLTQLGGQSTSPKEVADALKLVPSTVRREMQVLLAQGAVRREAKGRYVAVEGYAQLNRDDDPPVQATLRDFAPVRKAGLGGLRRRERDDRRRAIIEAILLRILEGKDGGSPQRVARALNFTPARIHYYMRLMKAQGLIERKVRSNIAVYDVTEKAVSLLRASLVKPELPIGRFENFCVAYPIVRDNPEFLPAAKGVELAHGVKRTDGKVEVDGRQYSVLRFHSPSGDAIYIYATGKYAVSEAEAVAKASVECHCVAQEIQRRHGLVLGEPRVVRGGELEFRDAFAVWYKAGGGPNVRTLDGWIDASPPSAKRLPAKAKRFIPGELGFPVGRQPLGRGPAQAYIDFWRKAPELFAKLVETNTKVLEELTVLEKAGVTTQQQIKVLTDSVILLVGRLDKIAEALERPAGKRERSVRATESSRLTNYL